MAASTATDGRHNGALGAARDVGLESGLADTLNDVFDLLFGGAVDMLTIMTEYLRCPFLLRAEKKPRSNRGFGGISETLANALVSDSDSAPPPL